MWQKQKKLMKPILCILIGLVDCHQNQNNAKYPIVQLFKFVFTRAFLTCIVFLCSHLACHQLCVLTFFWLIPTDSHRFPQNLGPLPYQIQSYGIPILYSFCKLFKVVLFKKYSNFECPFCFVVVITMPFFFDHTSGSCFG